MKTFSYCSWFLAFIFSLVTFNILLSQNMPVPITWGDITQENLNSTVENTDSNATAIILCDYGTSKFDNDLNISFTRHRRIKIINTKGYKWGNHSFLINNEKNGQEVIDIKGATYIFDENGKQTTHDMESDAIFEEEAEKGYTRVRFTLPALAPGCIIEYRYTIISRNWSYMPEWYFQYEEPALWSEFRVQIPEILEYVFLIHGTTPFSVSEENSYSFNISRNQWERQGDLYTTKSDIKKTTYRLNGIQYRWIMKDVSAFREEPFMTTVNDYRKKIGFQLSKTKYPGEPQKNIMTTWDKAVNELNKAKEFGKQLDAAKSIKKLAKEIVDTVVNPKRQMELLSSYVQKSIKWNEEYRILANSDLDDVLESKSGNDAEIGLLLTTLLRAVNIESYPVILSTRSHGAIVDFYPFLRQFNHVIVYAKVGSETFLLDATDNNRPASMLPPESLNHLGLLVSEEGGKWVVIEAGKMYSVNNSAAITIDETANISGKLQAVDYDYSAYNRRSELKRGKEREFITAKYDTDEMGFIVDTFRIVNSDQIEKPFISLAEIHSESYAQKSDNFIYLNPVLYNRWTENPLKLKGRSYPIDLTYRRKNAYTLNLMIPETFRYKECPQPITVKLNNGGGEYKRIITIDSLMAQYVIQFEITKDRFEPEEYSALQEFFNKIIALESEVFVLEKRGTLKK